MNYARLKRNITDNIREAHAKLGYEKRAVSLNYTLGSLNNILGAECDTEGMKNTLEIFSESVSEIFGEISFREIKDGFCITVSAEGTEYIHTAEGMGFIEELVETVRNHNATMSDTVEVFHRYSDNVKTEKKQNGEFDLLVCFEDGKPDEYIYCLSEEEEIDGHTHISYHRFIREDYEEFNF